ncbi:MAG: DUF45 domain-containing protein [Clostridiales bacterium]|nr:DUF45 domain-containing protein [Clostridiales bacterium]
MKVEVTRTLKNVVKMRYEDGVLKVMANYFVSNKRLRKIIADNSEWINKQKQEQIPCQKEEKKTVEPPKKKVLRQAKETDRPTDGKQVARDIFEGRKTVIMGDVIKVMSTVSAKTYVDGNVMYVNERYYQSREGRLKAIKSYLKKMALLYVSVEIANFGSDVSLCPAKIDFKDIGEFWVNCSLASQRVLCFDFRIVQLPQQLRTYLIAHAFAHFQNPIHNDKFWNFVSNILPRYQDYAKQLEQYHLLKDI